MVQKITRRTFCGATVASASAATLGLPAHAQGAPFRIGLLTVKTGPLAAGGIQMEQGITLFLKEKAHILAGRKIEFISADTGGTPAGAKTKAQELIERDKVGVILGPLAAFEMLAISDYVREMQTPVITYATAEDVTQRKANPFVLRTSGTSAQCSHALAQYAVKDLNYRRAATIVEDYAFGYEQTAGFQRVFEEGGGKITKKLWPPLSTPDYTPYLAQLGNVDCVYSGFAGSNPVKFMRAYADLGLKARLPLLAGFTAMDDALLRSLGDEAVGAISAAWYSADERTETNRRFVAAFQKENNVLPGAYSVSMYVAGQCVEAALRKLGGKASDRLALAEALRQVSLEDTPRGPVSFDKYGNVVGDVHIRKCERRDGKLTNTIIKRYPKVSQFWTYPEKEYLANPVYSRDWPPARNLEP